jgi:hypothetical protein
MPTKNSVVFIAVASLAILLTGHAVSHADHTSENVLLIGKDPSYNSNVYLHKDSIFRSDTNVTTATYCVDIDHLTEEYTAEYNCRDRTVHIFSVAVKDNDRTIEEKKLFIRERIARNTIDDRLLTAVCRYRTASPRTGRLPLN